MLNVNISVDCLKNVTALKKEASLFLLTKMPVTQSHALGSSSSKLIKGVCIYLYNH